MNKHLLKTCIKNIKIPLYIGIYEWEKNNIQIIRLSIVAYTKKAPFTTEKSMLCYDQLCQYLTSYNNQKFGLVEEFLDHAGHDLIKNFSLIEGLRIKVKKSVLLMGQPNELSITSEFWRE